MPSRVQNVKDDSLICKQGRFNIIPRSVRPYKATIIKWGLIGYLIRIAIMPLFAQTDLILIARTGVILCQNHQLVLSAYSLGSITWIFASVYALFNPILPNTVLSELTSNTSYTPSFALSSLFHLSQQGISVFLFISKIPYLVFDFALALLLLHMIDNGEKALLAFKLWIINPISIFISYAVGQFDIIPTFFLILALFFFKRRRELPSILSLGVCGALKMFGFLFMLPMALIYLKEHSSLKSKIKHLFLMFIVGFLPLAVSQISIFLTPIYYESANLASPFKFEIHGFFGNAFYSRGELGNPLLISVFSYILEYSFRLGLDTLGSIEIYTIPFIYGLFLSGIVYVRDWSFEKLWKAFLLFLIAYYAFAFFHPQWFVWGLPLLILLVAEDRNRYLNLYLLLIPLFFILTCYWNDYLTSLFMPIIHQAYFWPGPHDLLNYLGFPVYPVISIFRSIFSAVCIIFIVLMLGIDRLLHMSKTK